MLDQFIKYNIKYHIYVTPRFSSFKDKIDVVINSPRLEIPNLHIGATISFINAIKAWYDSSDEEYAIFCEDDISFESIEYWNFTWEEFYSKLPSDWECLQLVRMHSEINTKTLSDLQLDFRWGRWWGSSLMIKRSHAKKLLDIMYVGPGKYKISSQDGLYDPCVENCLMFNYNTVCNFPLLFENNFDHDPVDGINDSNWVVAESRMISNYIIRHQWKTKGKSLNLDEMMILK